MILEGTKIVAIDDTASIRTFLRVSLEDEGAQFHEAATARDGLQLCNDVRPDLVVLDLGLPDVDGLDILPEIKNIDSDYNPTVLILTVRKDKATIAKARKLGADGYLSKPFIIEDLLEIIEKHVQ